MTKNKLAAVTEVKIKKAVEVKAINELLTDIHSLIPVLEKFDKKIVNKRLFDALKATGKRLYDSEWLGVRTINLPSGCTVQNDLGHHIYPTYYREVTFDLVINEKRLDAAATVEKLKQVIDRMENAKVKYAFEESQALKTFEELERIEKQIEDLFKNSDNVTAEVMRNFSYRIK